MKVFLSPHNDDAVLFGSFTLLAHRPLVVTVLRSFKQFELYGITYQQRELEDDRAMAILGCEHVQWEISDLDTPWETVERNLRLLDRDLPVTTMYAPHRELVGGHDHHDRIADLAREVFGDRVVSYTTYSEAGKSRGAEVVPEPWMIPPKLQALACYTSQILTVEAACTDHFLRDLREYRA